MRILKRLSAALLLLLVVGLAALYITARLHDGPVAIIAGGPFTSGDLQSDPDPDWALLHETQEVPFQLLVPPRSHTSWVIEDAGKAWIPSGYVTTGWGKLWKRWPIEADQGGRILLRLDGKLYERRMVRVSE